MPRWLRGLGERVRVLLDRTRFEAELDEELRFHISEATRRNVEAGMTPKAAARLARQSLGGVEATKEHVRDETGVRLFQDVAQDLRFGVKTLAKRPAFSGALLATIAIAIGSNAAVFSVVKSILLEPLPFSAPEQIVRVFNNYPGNDLTRSTNSIRDFFDRQEGVESFEHVALYSEIAHTMGGDDGTQHVFAMQVTPSFFSVFGGSPAVGGLFPPELVRGAANYAVIGDALWRSAFGADPGVIGTTVILNGASYELVGVLPEEFRFATWDAQIYTPMVFTPEARFGPARNSDRFHMVARLYPEASMETAQAELDALNATLIAGYAPDERAAAQSAGFHSEVRGYLDDLIGPIRRPLLLLWLGAVIVLVAGLANVTTLFLIRAAGRRSEISCRLALGASRSRVLRQLLTESLIVAVVGGVLGLALAVWSLGFLNAFDVYEIPRVDDVGLGWGVLLSGVLASLAMGTFAALLPARGLLWGSTMQLGRGSRSDMSHKPSRVHHTLVGAQVAFSFVLIMTTGLLFESLRHLNAVELGFDPVGVAVGATNLPGSAYPDRAARVQFIQRLVDAVAAHPDVESAAVATQLPFSESEDRSVVFPDGVQAGGGDRSRSAYTTAVTPSYFQTMGIDLIEGQEFTRSDDLTSRLVAMIDEDLAGVMWPMESAVGRRVWVGENTGDLRDAYEVVGVVSSIRQNDLTGTQLPGAVYVPVAQRLSSSFFRIATSARGEAAGVPVIVQQAMGELDSALLYYWVDTMEGAVGGTLLFRRLPMRLLSGFAAVSLFLVILGVYGVTAHVVGSRTQELGLRMALGGTPSGVVSLLAREWTAVVVGGVGVGLLGTLVVVQVVRHLLFGTSALDPSVVVATMLLLVLVAGMAFLWPVRSAVRIDPATALKESV